MNPRRLHSDTSLSMTSGWDMCGDGVGSTALARHWMCRTNLQASSRIQLCAQPRGRRGLLAEQARDDLIAVEPPVLDEDLVRVVARHDDAGDEQARQRRLQRC